MRRDAIVGECETCTITCRCLTHHVRVVNLKGHRIVIATSLDTAQEGYSLLVEMLIAWDFAPH